jgi:hypothetical protein
MTANLRLDVVRVLLGHTMKLDRWLIGALAATAIVAVASYPLLGFSGSVPVGAATFGVAALVGSGYDAVRAVAWGLAVAALSATGILVPGLLGGVLYAAGAALFFAGFLAPTFRRWWFGKSIEG